MNGSEFRHRLRLLMGSRTKMRLVVTVLVAALAASLLAFHSPRDDPDFPTVTFFQLDVNFDGDSHLNSEWGSVDLEFVGSKELLYFNLTVESGGPGTAVWRIRNVPVRSREGLGVLQTTTFHFNLGNTPGDDVGSLDYAYALTTSPLTEMPGPIVEAAVAPRPYSIDTGYGGTPILFAPPSEFLAGGAAAGGACSHSGFPNPDVGPDECVPAATSNSLNWMNEFYGLGIPPALITVEAMKGATGFDPGLPGCDDNWPELKAAYLRKHQIPVTSDSIDALRFGDVLQAICAGCDVEISIGKHTAAVTSIVRLAGGNYELDFTHDADQNGTGGTITEPAIYDDVLGRFEGSAWNNNKAPDHIVVECPEFGGTPTPTATPTETPTSTETRTPRPTKTRPPTRTPSPDSTQTPRPTKTRPPHSTKTPRPTKTPPTDPTKTKTPRPRPTKTPPPAATPPSGLS